MWPGMKRIWFIRGMMISDHIDYEELVRADMNDKYEESVYHEEVEKAIGLIEEYHAALGGYYSCGEKYEGRPTFNDLGKSKREI